MKTLTERIEEAASDMGFDRPEDLEDMLHVHGLTIVVKDDLQKIRTKVAQLQVLLAPKDEE